MGNDIDPCNQEGPRSAGNHEHGDEEEDGGEHVTVPLG